MINTKTNNKQSWFTNSSELQNLTNYYRRASARIDAAKSLSERGEKLAIDCYQFILSKFPEYRYSDKWKESCIRDVNYFIRFTTYSLVSGDTSTIDEYLIPELKELYQSLGLPISCCIYALKFLKQNHGLVAEEAEETVFYIDYLLSKLS